MQTRAAIYTRISSDPHGKAKNVASQEADARALCERRGWTVVDVFCDNDISAFSGKPRPGYTAMMEAVRRREVDAIVAWHPDRLHRQTRELVGFIDAVVETGVAVETVTAGTVDLTTPSGRMQARIVGAVAEHESEHKAERIRRKLQQNAADGKHHGGSRPYGWQEDRVSLDVAEAGVVREAARLVLAGRSVKAIARHLNESGMTTATGRPWRDVTVRDMLTRARNAGIREYKGEPVGRGDWEPILDEPTHLQVRALLLDPSRRTTPGRDGAAHLLTAIGLCGDCGGPLVRARQRSYKGLPGNPIYRCRKGHVSRDQAAVDGYVGRVMIARLSRDDARDLLVEPLADESPARAAEAEALRQRLDDAASAYAAGVLTMAQLTTITNDLRPKIDAAEQATASPARRKVLGEFAGREAAEVWASLAVEQRKAVVDLLAVVHLERTGRGKIFNPDSVRIEWR